MVAVRRGAGRGRAWLCGRRVETGRWACTPRRRWHAVGTVERRDKVRLVVLLLVAPLPAVLHFPAGDRGVFFGAGLLLICGAGMAVAGLVGLVDAVRERE